MTVAGLFGAIAFVLMFFSFGIPVISVILEYVTSFKLFKYRIYEELFSLSTGMFSLLRKCSEKYKIHLETSGMYFYAASSYAIPNKGDSPRKEAIP